MMKWLKINQDDAKPMLEIVNLPDGKDWLPAAYRQLSCSSIECVHCYIGGIRFVLVIDEEGKCKDEWNKRINTIATKLYNLTFLIRFPYDCIVGDCLIGKTVQTGNGYDIVPLSKPETLRMIRLLELL